VVVTTNGVVVKRVNRKKNSILLSSDNKVYEPYEEQKDEVLAVYEAHRKISGNFNNENASLNDEINILKSEMLDVQRVIKKLKND